MTSQQTPPKTTNNAYRAPEDHSENVPPISAISDLRTSDGARAHAYLQDVLLSAAKEVDLPLPAYVFGLQHVTEIFYKRARTDNQTFIPWMYLDDILDDINGSLREGQIVKPVQFADTIVFEQAWDPRQKPRMTVFKPLVEAIYGIAHTMKEHRLGPVSAYSQLSERLDEYLDVASIAAERLRKQSGKTFEDRAIIIVQSDKELFG